MTWSSPIRAWLTIAPLCAACHSPASLPSPQEHRDDTLAQAVVVPPFGDLTIEDGALELLDHNSGDGRVHRLTVSRDFQGSTLSWADRPGPRSDVRVGTFPISPEERDQVRSWSEQLWRLAPGGRRSFPRAAGEGRPGYEWAIVVRRGAEVRVIDGGAAPATDSELIEGVVDFLDMHF